MAIVAAQLGWVALKEFVCMSFVNLKIHMYIMAKVNYDFKDISYFFFSFYIPSPSPPLRGMQ